MRKTTARACALLIALLVLFSSAVPVFAEGGDGSGGGEGVPLQLAESSVKNGAKDVDPNVRIVLTFNKNVVNFAVRDENKKCFSVADSSGKDFPITVEMGDDQVDPSIKRIVTIVPQSPYAAGETYVLTVRAGLRAKNGVSVLEDDATITFTVAAQTTAAPKPTSAPPATTAAPAPAPSTFSSAGSPAANASITTTTTKPATSTKPATTATTKKAPEKETSTTVPAARPQITRTATTAAATTTAAKAVTTGSATFRMSIPTTFTFTETTAAEETLLPTEAESESVFAPTEPETTAADMTDTTTAPSVPDGTETAERHVSPILIIGIVIAAAAVAAAVFAIQKVKHKKG